MKFFGQKSEKCSHKIRKKFWKERKTNYFSRNFYSGYVDRILRAMPKVSAENPTRFKISEKKFQATNCSSGNVECSFENFLKFCGRKSEKILLKIRKNSEKENKKNYFFSNFYSGHLDKFLRTTPKVSTENSKRFKVFLKKFKATSCSCGHAEGSFHNFFSKFFGQKSEKFSLIIRKNSKNKTKKLFSAFFTLDT